MLYTQKSIWAELDFAKRVVPCFVCPFLAYYGEDNGTLLQDSCLENPMDGVTWKATVHGVAEGQTWLTDFPLTFDFHALKKEMATHSSVLAWRIPGTGGPGGLPSMGSHRVGHDWSDSAAAADASRSLACFEAAVWNRWTLLLCSLVDNVIFIFPWWHMFGKELSLHI